MLVSIHLLGPGNAGLLTNIAPDVFDHEVRQDLLVSYLADRRHAMFVAVENGVVVGQIRGNVHLQPDRASDLYIDNLGTTPSRQRRGIATQLIRELLAWGEAQGCTYVWLATEPDNEGGILFYESRSFQRSALEMFAIEIGGAGET